MIFENLKQRVAIYTRVSTDEQVAGNGLDIQEKALMQFIEQHKDKYVFSRKNFYVDEGKSGAKKTKEDRPALFKMFADAKNKQFDIVLVWKIDRFFRKTLFLLEGVEALDSLGVGFISITQPFDTTQAFGRMMLQMMGVIAELERDLIRERTHNGILNSMKKGKWGRGSPPYGYTVDNNKNIIIKPKEAENVKLFFNLLVDKELSLSQLVHKVNNLGIETSAYSGALGKQRKTDAKHTNFWSRGVLHRIVRREMYMGKMIQNRFTKDKLSKSYVERPKEEWIIGECPAIISKETFDRAQKQLEKNERYSPRNKVNRVYMLSTLLIDKETGFKYSGYMSCKKTRNYRLTVGKEKSKDKVPSKGVSGKKIEPIVWKKVKSVLLNPRLILKELEKLSKDNNEEYVRYQIKSLQKKKKDLEANTRFLLSTCSSMDVEDLKIMQDTIQNNREQIDRYSIEIADLNSLILSTKEKQKQLKDLQKLSKKIHKYISKDNIPYELKTQICRLLVEKVYIGDNGKVEIFMYIPVDEKKRDHKTDIVENMFDTGRDLINTALAKIDDAKNKLREISSELELCHNIGTPGRDRTHANLGPRPSALPLSYGSISESDVL